MGGEATTTANMRASSSEAPRARPVSKPILVVTAVIGSIFLILGLAGFIFAIVVRYDTSASITNLQASSVPIVSISAGVGAACFAIGAALIAVSILRVGLTQSFHLPLPGRLVLNNFLTQTLDISESTDEWVSMFHENPRTAAATATLANEHELHKKQKRQAQQMQLELSSKQFKVSFLDPGGGRHRSGRLVLDYDGLQLKYQLEKSRWNFIKLHQIKEVRFGQRTKAFERFAGKFRAEADLSFSIIYGENYATLDIICKEAEDYSNWSHGLVLVLAGIDNGDKTKAWLKSEWEKADTNGDGVLDLQEIMHLLRILNSNIRKDDALQAFQRADLDSGGTLDFNEFVIFYQDLTQRTDIKELFDRLAKSDESEKLYLTKHEMFRFIQETQKITNMTLQEVHQLICQIEGVNHEDSPNSRLSFRGFVEYLEGPHGLVHRQFTRTVDEDMTQPLTSYYISCSHNTYLLGDQLTGESSVEAYIRALQTGCRCLELDTWDGENGDPVITHGNTMTSTIPFADVIMAIKTYAFQLSPYPVILSFENHCSPKQQIRMSEIMLAVFDDLLYTDADSLVDQLPSPNDLKFKIFVKSKVPRQIADAPTTEVLLDDSDDEGNRASSLLPNSRKSALVTNDGMPSSLPNTNPLLMHDNITADVDDQSKTMASPISSPVTSPHSTMNPSSTIDSGRVSKSLAGPAKHIQTAKIAAEFAGVVALISSRFVSFSATKAKSFANDMFSISEKKMHNLSAKAPTEFVSFNNSFLTRIYPAGTRVNSSNLDPVRAWKMGCHMVALNYQTNDAPMHLNRGRFRQNGRCGYVLKPKVLRNPEVPFDPTRSSEKFHLNITVISGKHLPKPNNARKGEVVDPFVEIELSDPVDLFVKKRTKTIQNNGFFPNWNETLTFEVHSKDLAMIRFVVYDEDIGSVFNLLGVYAMPVNEMLSGYRHVPLELAGGELLEQSKLFVKIDFLIHA